MTVAELVDDSVMEHIALYGCVKNLDPYALHLLKTSQHPILRFRRDWMRRTALRQHLDAEKRQKKMNAEFKAIPRNKGAAIQQSAVVDTVLADEMRHYGKTTWNDKSFLRSVRAEAPAIFPKRE